MKAKIENKNKVLFWLKRREKVLAGAVVDHEALAKQGASYQQRTMAVEGAAKQAEDNKAELESVREAIRFIEENAEG